MPRIPWKWTAFIGVRWVSWIAANQRGSRLTRPRAKITRVDAFAPAVALASELFRIAKTTSRPPSVGRTSFAIPLHGSPLLNARNSACIRSGPKYTVAAYMLKM